MKAENRRSGNRMPAGDPASRDQRRHVVLAESDGALRRALAQELGDAGYLVTECGSSDEGLAVCARIEPEVMICNLRGAQGVEFCRAFRAIERRSRGYLVMLAHGEANADIARVLGAGADDFVSDPITGPKLLARVAVAERVLQVEAELHARNRQLADALDCLKETQAALDRDMREARKLQQGLVRERTGRFGQIEMSLLLRPAGHIGGDLVGFFPIGEDRVGFYALDVSGHGITAALLTAQLSVHLSGSSDQNVALRAAQSGSEAVTPAALAHFFNNMMLEEMQTDTYFTLIYAEMNHVTGDVQMVQAGHPHPMLHRADGSVMVLGQGGMPVGVVENPIFDELEFTLGPGDRLLIASDGITEAADASGRQLSEEGLEAIMRTNAFLGGHAFLESMAWSVSEYCRGERLDDMSAVLIEYRAPAPAIPLSATAAPAPRGRRRGRRTRP